MSGKEFAWRCIVWFILLIPIFCFLIQMFDIFKDVLFIFLSIAISAFAVYLVLRGILFAVGFIYWSIVGPPDNKGDDDAD
jgi:hypothetical protein